jgi:hypothetical protein
MSKLATTAAALLALLCLACVSRHPHGMPPGQAKKIGHVHAAGCGHEQVDGVWVSVAVGTHPGQGPKK